jgi:phosphoserine phosphatase RsbU/P
LRVLIVEDSPDHTELLLEDLRRAGYHPAYERVETGENMRAALGARTWDLVMSDHSAPQ